MHMRAKRSAADRDVGAIFSIVYSSMTNGKIARKNFLLEVAAKRGKAQR
jgi:hypothetical protein